MATARVLDIGQCVPDHSSIRSMIESKFDAEVRRVTTGEEALAAMQEQPYDLVLVNRELDIDLSCGIDLISRLRESELGAKIPMMLVSNYAEAHEKAVSRGAVHGFGKAALQASDTQERLAEYLPAKATN